MDVYMFRPPVLVGERIVWLGSGTGLPQGGVVRWIGKLPEMGPDWTVGVELDNPLPYGGIDGNWGNRHLFTCEPKHGLLVPITKTIRESDLNWWHGCGQESVHHGEVSGETEPRVQSRSPSLPRTKSYLSATTPVRPTRRASPTQPVTAPQPAVRRRKQQLPYPETSGIPPLPPSRRPGKLARKSCPSLQQVVEEPETLERTDSNGQSRDSEDVPFPIDISRVIKCLQEENFIQLLKQLNVSEANDGCALQKPKPAVRKVNGVCDAIPKRVIARDVKCSNGNELAPVSVDLAECSRNCTPAAVVEVPDPKSVVVPVKTDDAAKDVLVNRANTLLSCTSGEYSDYSWYDARDDKTCDYADCSSLSNFYEPVLVNGDVGVGTCYRPKDSAVHEEDSSETNSQCSDLKDNIMNHVANQNTNHLQNGCSSYVSTVVVRERTFSNQLTKEANFKPNSTDYHSTTSTAARKDKTSSGFFSFLRWFKRSKDGDDSDDAGNTDFEEGLNFQTEPSSPELVRSHSSSCGSIDTLFSTATVNSFAFITPTCYRPFGNAIPPEKRIAVGPDTDTYRNRLYQRDKVRELDKNITLRKKYNLYGSGTIQKSLPNTPEASPVIYKRKRDILYSPDNKENINGKPPNPSPGSQNCSFGRKKRKAPEPPILKPKLGDSLPNTLENKSRSNEKTMENGDISNAKYSFHRRTASESSKDKRAGAYCHVQGKRRAPPPPVSTENLDTQSDNILSLGKKKRLAPQPPVVNGKIEDDVPSKATENKEIQTATGEEGKKSLTGKLSPDEKARLIANISILKAHANRKSMSISPPASPSRQDLGSRLPHEITVCNDSLKLERGVLKPNKELPKMEPGNPEGKVPPVSPRPWYKRNFSGKESGGIKRDIFKSLEKKKDKEKIENWMPEVGIPRMMGGNIPSDGGSTGSSRFSFFSRNDDKKKDGEKRKSQISMLANISELDREAAEIVQKEQAREQALLAAEDAKYYEEPTVNRFAMADLDVQQPESSNVEVPKRSSARELISLFNAIGNVTKVTVNSTFFSKEGSGFFSKESSEKRFSFIGESIKTTEERVVISEKNEVRRSVTVDSTRASGKSSETQTNNKRTTIFDVPGIDNASPGVTIEEIDEALDNNSKTRAMYEANRMRRHHSPSPSIPTITEQSESTSSAASTITTDAGSNRNSASLGQDAVACQSPDLLPFDQKPNIWACPRCTLENPRWKLTCDACGRWRPSIPDSNVEKQLAEEPSAPPASSLDVKKAIDWEKEIKKYFPGQNNDSNNGPKSIPKSNGTAFVKFPGATQTSDKSPPAPQPQLETVTEKKPALPSTFIGGRLPQDRAKKTASQHNEASSQPVVNAEKSESSLEKPDVDEVRKARLAFFNKTSENGEDYSSSNSGRLRSIRLPSDEKEQKKLKEMLKEMKNSLPKRPKKINQADVETLVNGEGNKEKETPTVISKITVEQDVKLEEQRKLGAIKKTPKQVTESKKSVHAKKDSSKTEIKPHLENGTNEQAEALFITRKTIYEDIKVKKSTPDKPSKVSTSVQTSGKVKKLDSAGASELQNQVQQISSTSEINGALVPVIVEEYSTGIKDGVLYTSLSKDSKKIGTGTFELIRARDFASIEATKVCNDPKALHVYANTVDQASPIQQTLVTSRQMVEEQTKTAGSPSASPQENRVVRNISSIEPVQPAFVESQQCQSSSRVTSPDSASFRDVRSSSVQSNSVSEASFCSAASMSSGDSSEVERLTAQLTRPKGLADFKADLEATPPAKNMNTLAINRLLRRLETAIAGGQHVQAAGLARDLARLKISCSVTRHRHSLDSSSASVIVDMYVEDKVSHQGPIPLQVMPSMTVAQLKEKVEAEFDIPMRVQRWILGKLLASDDTKTLAEHNITSNGCPMFLYLVVPDGDQDKTADAGVDSRGISMATSPEMGTDEDAAAASEAKQLPPPPPGRPGGGWYYNDEDERYSFCEDSEAETELELSDGEAKEEITNKTPAKPPERQHTEQSVANDANEQDGDDDEEEEEEDEEEYEEESDEEEDGPAVVVVHEPPVVFVGPPPATPAVVHQQATSAGASGGPDPHSGVLRPAAVDKRPVESDEEDEDQLTGTLRLGWKCPVCTLMNAPTRPGCAACTTERPLDYVVPVGYRVNQQELQRMQQEQRLDDDLQQAADEEKQQAAAQQQQHYLQLVDLERADLVPNMDQFECPICFVPYEPGEGVVLRDCLHTFCRGCLANTVQFNEEAEVKCPYRDANYACDSVLLEREIKALVPPHVYEQHLAKSVAQAENKIGNAFHCKTPDCRGWCIFEDNVNEFKCPVCHKVNCLTCQAIHDGVNCKQYQEKVKQASETDADARRTKEMLEEMVDRGEAMACPTCQVVLMKKWGCDWLRCSMCKTEICWVTRGPRWGPGGKGDTTGGCQCGVNGVKCHPRCNYCH